MANKISNAPKFGINKEYTICKTEFQRGSNDNWTLAHAKA